jgi:hypothetical protein
MILLCASMYVQHLVLDLLMLQEVVVLFDSGIINHGF